MHKFPYLMCKKDSDIVLYGAGECGLEFYVELEMNQFCNVVAWVDRKFDDKMQAPFDTVKNLTKYEYDFIVLAIENYASAMEAKAELMKAGVPKEKIVWSAQYIYTTDFFPKDKNLLYSKFDFYSNLFMEYMKSGIEYGANQYYQSSNRLHLNGARSTGLRIKEYEIEKYLTKDMSVLNIGCNIGFLDVEIAPYVNKITGVDINEGVLNVAKQTADYLCVKNASFIHKNVFKDGITDKYDAVLVLAVHGAVENDDEFCRIEKLLNPNGMIFFESHEIPGDEAKYLRRVRCLEKTGMKLLCVKVINDNNINRMFTVLKKRPN